jgi:2TM domain
MNEDPRVLVARRKVAAMQGFYMHLGIFLAVMLVLAIINALTGNSWWVQWPLLGWGIGVAFHGLGVFGLPGGFRLFSQDWEERKIAEIVKKMRS